MKIKETTSDIYVPDAKFEMLEPEQCLAGSHMRKAHRISRLPAVEGWINEFLGYLIDIFRTHVGPFFFIKYIPGVEDDPDIIRGMSVLERHGLISGYTHINRFHDIPPYVAVRTNQLEKTIETDGRTDVFMLQQGSGFTTKRALSKAIGEFYERYPLMVYKERDFLKASIRTLRSLRKHFLDMREFLYDNENPDRQPITDLDIFLWTEGRQLLDNKKVYIPAQMVYWNYDRTHQGRWEEKFQHPQNTNGMASGTSRAQALLNGIHELVERDGALMYWYNGIAPLHIRNETLPEGELRSFVTRCEQYGLEIHLLNVTTDIAIPACACVVIDRSLVGPKFAIGSAAGLRWEEILLSALFEALEVYTWLRSQKEEKRVSFLYSHNPAEACGIVSGSIEKRLLLWAHPNMFQHCDFFLSGKTASYDALPYHQPRAFSSTEDELAYVSRCFQNLGRGYEVVYYQADSFLLKEAGRHAVHVIIPALVPLDFSDRYVSKIAGRLSYVPAKLALSRSHEGGMARWPHPLP